MGMIPSFVLMPAIASGIGLPLIAMQPPDLVTSILAVFSGYVIPAVSAISW
jgi:hypothetical protein